MKVLYETCQNLVIMLSTQNYKGTRNFKTKQIVRLEEFSSLDGEMDFYLKTCLIILQKDQECVSLKSTV